jgi:hypothetical protein
MERIRLVLNQIDTFTPCAETDELLSTVTANGLRRPPTVPAWPGRGAIRQGVRCGTLMSLCVPSQYGLMAEAPHRLSATVFRSRGTAPPDGVRIAKSPRTIRGPSGQTTIELGAASCSPGASVPCCSGVMPAPYSSLLALEARSARFPDGLGSSPCGYLFGTVVE